MELVYSFFRGEDISILVHRGADALGLGGEDLTGCTIVGKCQNLNDSSKYDFTIENVALASGLFRMKLPASQTASMPTGTYVFDYKITYPNGDIDISQQRRFSLFTAVTT